MYELDTQRLLYSLALSSTTSVWKTGWLHMAIHSMSPVTLVRNRPIKNTPCRILAIPLHRGGLTHSFADKCRCIRGNIRRYFRVPSGPPCLLTQVWQIRFDWDIMYVGLPVRDARPPHHMSHKIRTTYLHWILFPAIWVTRVANRGTAQWESQAKWPLPQNPSAL